MSTDLWPVLTQDVPPPTPAVAAVLPLPSFDERWEAWRAKGAAHDRAVNRKLAIAAPLIAVAGAILYALVGR